jgi:hypothetical protein
MPEIQIQKLEPEKFNHIKLSIERYITCQFARFVFGHCHFYKIRGYTPILVILNEFCMVSIRLVFDIHEVVSKLFYQLSDSVN